MPFPVPVSTFHHDIYPSIDPSNADLSQAGKVIVVTGGSQGIGLAIAKAFVTADAAHVVILGRTQSTLDAARAELASGKAQVHAFAADVSDEDRVNAVFAEIHSTIGPIDVVVANAAVLANQPFRQQTAKDLRRSFDINATAIFITAQAFLQHKNAAPTSTFIQINSAVAHILPMVASVSYIASKAAAARIVEVLQAECPDVRAFNVHPGMIATAMAKQGGFDSEKAPDTPELPGGYAVYLSSPKADWLKGRYLWTSWDVDELREEWGARVEKNPNLFTISMGGWPFEGKMAAAPMD